MFSADQIKKAEKCKVVKTGEGNKFVHFTVTFNDSKGKHEHQVSFDKATKKISCDCTWCSYYGLKKTNREKRCYNCLAVMQKLNQSI